MIVDFKDKQSIEQARQFLTLLDETTEEFTFQTFDDDKERSDGYLAEWTHGTIDNLFNRLVDKNNKGAGVFVMVNHGNGKGRNNASIERVRCVFQELDDGEIKQSSIEPQIVVESSKGKYHKYWLNDGLSFDEFNLIIERMVAEYGSDPAAKGLCRVLRLPGFFHLKDKENPHMVQVIHESGTQNYTKEQIIKSFPPLIIKKPVYNEPLTPYIVDDKTEQICIDRIISILERSSQGNRHKARIDAGRLAGGFISGGLLSENIAFDVLMSASDRKSDKGFTNKSEMDTILDGIQYGKELPIRSIFVKREYENIDIKKHDEIILQDKKTILDSTKKYCNVDLLQHIPDSHLLKKLSMSIGNATHLPYSTVFLTGLGAFSSVSNRSFKVKYEHNGTLPIGLYIVTEQPSGAAKSWCLNTFLQPFSDIHYEHIEECKEQLASFNQMDEEGVRKLEDSMSIPLFATNTTAEALESSLKSTNGFFSAVSSEQGLFNSLLGISYGDGKANNNDLVLSGFNGDYISTMRISRAGFAGFTAGGITMFAQDGSVEKLLAQSQGTGLSERFLMMSEQHNLGNRDWLESNYIDDDLILQYEKICRLVFGDSLKNQLCFKTLPHLSIDREGWILIKKYRNKIEPGLMDGGKFSHISLRGSAGKVDMQIMKIASNLHFFGHAFELGSLVISNSDIESAIYITDELLNAHLGILTDKGIIGVKAEYMSILSVFERDNRPRTFEQLRSSRLRVEPFSSFTGNKSEMVKKTLDDMVKDGFFTLSYSANGALLYSINK